jgi:CBS domain-containing protein
VGKPGDFHPISLLLPGDTSRLGIPQKYEGELQELPVAGGTRIGEVRRGGDALRIELQIDFRRNEPDCMTRGTTNKEDLMTMPGIPAGGLKTVGQIDATNPLVFYAGQNGLEIAVALCSTHTAGAPVVDANGRYLGFINEFDIMKMLDEEQDLGQLPAEHIMRKDRLVITPSTKISDAAKMMEEHGVVGLPVERDGVVTYSVTRHDLLRARIGLGVGWGIDP